MACCIFGRSGKATRGNLKIKNDTIALFKKTDAKSAQMKDWEENFPAEIRPQSEVNVEVAFITRRSQDMRLDCGEVTYEVFDNAGLSLAVFTVKADAQQSTVSCCCCFTFVGNLTLDWQTLPKVFGVTVEPRDGNVGFKKRGTVGINISGKLLMGGPRQDDALELKLTEWMPWSELQNSGEVEPGDVLGVDRGAFRHYGICERIEPDGTVMVSHLVGTAGGLIKEHGLGGGVKEVWSALTGSHGDIAGVETQTLEQFTTGDKCRVENLHEDEWRPYQRPTLLQRIGQATGFKDYSLFEFNCEHYANLMRYGMPHSAQIEAMRRKFDMAEQGRILKKQISKGAAYTTTEVKQMSSAAGKAMRSEMQILGTGISKGASSAGNVVKTEWSSFTTNVSEKFTFKMGGKKSSEEEAPMEGATIVIVEPAEEESETAETTKL